MRWIGDDTPAGWAITLAYLLGAALVLNAARRVARVHRRFLAASGIALALLGVNKQLDLQTLVFRAGRRATFALGLYPYRDVLHVIFPVLVGVVLGALGLIVLRSLRGHLRILAPVLFGFALLVCFVVLRVALFSHLVRVLGWDWLETGATLWLEGAAIALIAVGAQRAARTREP